MRFGTFYFFQAAPGQRHEDIIRGELEQIVWSEELGFDETVEIMRRAWTEERFSYDGRFFKVPEMSVIPKPVQRPHPPLYQVCVTKDGIENTALRGWPMLNSVLFGPVDQLIANRDIYVDTLKKAGRGADEIKSLLARCGGSRQIYVAETH